MENKTSLDRELKIRCKKSSIFLPGGRKYVEQPKTGIKIILFVRDEKKDGFGNTSPFHCFGLVDYVSSHDDFPMNVKWKLQKPAMAQYLKAI